MTEPGQLNIEIENYGIFREWPPLDEYKRIKREIFKKYKPILKSKLEDGHYYFFEAHKEKTDEAVDLLSSFVFGVDMVYRRFGFIKKEIPVEFVYRGNINTRPFDVAIENNRPHYRIFLGTLIDIVRGYSKRDRIRHLETGGLKLPKVEDLYEIGGVEEGAHYIYLNKKRKPSGFMNFREGINDKTIRHHTADIERSGLIWKIQYSARYKPEYFSSLKELEKQVIIARK